MKQVRQWYYAVCAVLVLMLASCQAGNIAASTAEVYYEDEYASVSVLLPSSRGWTAAKYTVTAKRSGEADVTGETTGTSLKMSLKVGRWTFTAVGYDNNNAAIFCSDPVESDIKADGSTVVSIMLTQKSASVDLTANVPAGLQDKLTKIVITAAAKAGEDFTVSKDTASIGGKIRLYDLLADCEYTITADGYIGEVKYASGSLSAKKFDNDGQITAETITLKQTRVTPVAASPASGHGFSNADGTITLTCGTAGASIYYTTDGTEPTVSSNKYSDPIALFSGTAKSEKTLKAVAYASGMSTSDVLTTTYSFDPTKYASPTFSPQGGTFNKNTNVTLTSSDSGAIKYSFDGTNWTDYSAAIAINGSQTSDVTKTIYAKVSGDGTKTESAVVSQEYVISYPTASEVLFSASGSTPYNTETTFTLSCSTESAKIYYTTDGTAPTASATQYSAPFTLTAGTHTVKAIAIADGYKYSAVLVQSLSVVKNITSISFSSASADLIVGGSSATFTVIFTPADTNADTTIQWSVSDEAVVRLMPNGTSASVSGLKAGSATLTATLKNASSITATATLNVTTTTVAPVQSTELGKRHPATGVYSLVDSANWSSQTYALGANIADGNTTFSLYSKNATKVLLEIYDAAYGEDAKYDYWMTKNATTDCWQAKLSGDLSNKLYAFRCWGPNWTYSTDWKRGGSVAGFVSDCDAAGNRFNPNKVVYDPYAREMSHDPSNATAIAAYKTANTGFEMATPVYQILSTGATYRNYDSGTIAPKGYIITDSTSFGTKPAIEQKDAIIYEAHVRGLTKHSSTANLKNLLKDYATVSDIPEEYRGTYKGATYMIPYLKAIGINTIELLPVHETDNDANPDNGPGGNFWGYMTFDYFAPDRRYSSDKTAGGPTREFKEMVKAFHDNGMEVYLDVVYNHSGEGGPWNGADDTYQQCTVVSMRGIDNATYYSLVQTNKAAYWESTGCGNNLQCDNTYVRQFILDSLTYWIDKMGVDGFRFDLATTLGRELSGSSWNYNANAATLTQIASLGRTKNVEMIAESWDCGGDSYQVGNFPDGWAGWNGYYRDTIRGFVGNAAGSASISYTDALYGDMAHFGLNEPSINFIVAHDGFTLADLASYSGTGNYHNNILTWPFGPSDGGSSDNNPIGTGETHADRRQRIRNYFTLQMFGAGIPMIVYGDELGRTQNGNNNPYNIDSVATWNNYDMANSASPQKVSTGKSGIPQETGSYADMLGTFGNTSDKNGNLAFAKYVMNERANNESLRQITGGAFEWYSTAGVKGWADEGNKKGILINGSGSIDGATYYMMINMTNATVKFTPPASPTGSWRRIIATNSYYETDLNCWPYASAWVYDDKGYGVDPYTVAVFKGGETVPACKTPVISGTTPFTDSTSVAITCATPNAKIYYTTDGTKPDTNSTPYSGAFSLTESKTVKAIAVLAGYKDSAAAEKYFRKKSGESATVNKSGVMLQGFNWDSAPRPANGEQYDWNNKSPHWQKWYSTVTSNASAIKDTFEYVWCPPPSKTDTASSEGYGPTQLNDLNNCYGTEEQQKAMINAIKPAKAIADIVINHRAGSASWGDFTNPSWCDDYYAICSDDEGFTNSSSPMYGSIKKGAADTGAGYSAYRDLDHTNPAVQNGIIAWMDQVLMEAGYAGWRYDYVKGYGGRYVGQYDAATEPVISVGEYWPTAGYDANNSTGWGDEIKNWIAATQTGGYRSKAFDFALKGAMNSIFGFKGSNGAETGSFNYGHLADTANLVISQPEDAVTFVDNHDTGSTQSHWMLNEDYVGAAYAFILTHPGVPCVAWQHYFTYAESGSTKSGGDQYLAGKTVAGTSNTLRQHIDSLITLRKNMGIEYDSTRINVATTKSHYVADITGTGGTLRVCIGSGYTPPAGAVLENTYSGDNFAIWKIDPNYVRTTETVTLYCQHDAGSGNTIYFTGAFDEAENWTKIVRGTWNAGNVWTATVTHETGCQFEWKVLKYTSGNGMGNILNVPAEGATWQPDPNNVYPTTAGITVSGDFGTVSPYTPPTPPALDTPTVSPASASLVATETLTLTATASLSAGSGTLTYQWYKDGAAITGATSSVYTKQNIATDDDGQYKVRVGVQGYPDVTKDSAEVSVTVQAGPSVTIGTQPATVNAANGSSVTLTVAAASGYVGTLTYQWYKGGAAITGATSASYTISSVAESDYATYYVIITASVGSVTVTATSDNATVAKPDAVQSATPTITAQPAAPSQEVYVGDSVMLSVTATRSDDGTLTYQWYKDGAAIADATSDSYTVPTETAASAEYRVTVTNTVAGGIPASVTSNTVSVTVYVGPLYTFGVDSSVWSKGSKVFAYVWKADADPAQNEWLECTKSSDTAVTVRISSIYDMALLAQTGSDADPVWGSGSENPGNITAQSENITLKNGTVNYESTLGKVIIKFTNNHSWVDVYYYTFTGDTKYSGDWPGTKATEPYKNDSNQDVYIIEVPAGASYIIFSDGQNNQTVDLDATTNTGYYISGTNGDKYTCTTW